MEKRAIKQPANPVLPARTFVPDALLPPGQAVVAFFSRVNVAPRGVETVALEHALGRVLARSVAADDDYPSVARAAMDGFAVLAESAPGTFDIAGDVLMGIAPQASRAPAAATRIPTGGVLPPGTDAVVPFEELRIEDGAVLIEEPVRRGDNVVQCAADMRRGEPVLHPNRRIRACDVGVLAALGVMTIEVYTQPRVAVVSSGDELIDAGERPAPGQVRDSNRFAIAASLRAMGAAPRHYPTLRDEADAFEATLARAVAQCDAVAVTGGSSVGDRDRLPDAMTKIGEPGIVVHGLRVKPGKPTLLGAHSGKPILGLPGNPTSALLILEAVAAPIVAALCGAPMLGATVTARLGAPARSRPGWTYYIPVRLKHDGGLPLAHPLSLHSFSVSLPARSDGYIAMEERDEEWPRGTLVAVRPFLGGS